MDYNLVGIDTIRFSVSESGFNKWLERNQLEKVRVSDTPLTSSVLRSKVESGEYVRVVRINDSYTNKLSNYIIIGHHKRKVQREDETRYVWIKERHYLIEIAGLHQPTNTKTHKATYQVLKSLLEKYIIESVDLAFDFIARNLEIVDGNNVAGLLHSTISGTIRGTTYFAIGAIEGEEPLGSRWERDSLLYDKFEKECRHTQGLNPLWRRLEFRIDGEAPFREPLVHRPKATNKQILEGLMPYISQTPIVDTVNALAQTNISYEYLDRQLVLLFDGRVLRYYT